MKPPTITSDQLAALKRRNPHIGIASVKSVEPKDLKSPNTRHQHRRGEMNNTERRFAEVLKRRMIAKEILGYAFERYTILLAPQTTLTPDFAVYRLDGGIDFYEVKGHMEDDAAVKIKTAPQGFPMHEFYLVRWKNGDWHVDKMRRLEE